MLYDRCTDYSDECRDVLLPYTIDNTSLKEAKIQIEILRTSALVMVELLFIPDVLNNRHGTCIYKKIPNLESKMKNCIVVKKNILITYKRDACRFICAIEDHFLIHKFEARVVPPNSEPFHIVGIVEEAGTALRKYREAENNCQPSIMGSIINNGQKYFVLNLGHIPENSTIKGNKNTPLTFFCTQNKTEKNFFQIRKIYMQKRVENNI